MKQGDVLSPVLFNICVMRSTDVERCAENASEGTVQVKDFFTIIIMQTILPYIFHRMQH